MVWGRFVLRRRLKSWSTMACIEVMMRLARKLLVKKDEGQSKMALQDAATEGDNRRRTRKTPVPRLLEL
jgi:hypothetical protein